MKMYKFRGFGEKDTQHLTNYLEKSVKESTTTPRS